MNPVHQENAKVVPLRSSAGRGPADLPGIEDFYVLTADGELGRYRAEGWFSVEPEITERLRGKVDILLSQYRSGRVDDLAIGIVTASTPDQPWRSATLAFSDPALKEVFKTSNDPEAPLTTFQRRNKFKSVFQGMELVLDTKKASQPQYPRFCPVLFVPQVDEATLCKRYGLDKVDAANALEVLDLMAPFAPEEQGHPVLSGMVIEMRQAKITPELRRPSGLMLVEDADSPETGVESPACGDQTAVNPWQDLPEARDTCFNDGDPVPYWLLAWFAPFNQLNDLQRQFVSRGHTIAKKPSGATLIERGSQEDLSIYLVEGTLELEAFDGRRMTIVGGTRRAHLPISQLRPHAYTVKAATDVTVVLYSQVMVREITRITTTYKSRPAIEVTERSMLPDDPWGQAIGEPQAG